MEELKRLIEELTGKPMEQKDVFSQTPTQWRRHFSKSYDMPYENISDYMFPGFGSISEALTQKTYAPSRVPQMQSIEANLVKNLGKSKPYGGFESSGQGVGFNLAGRRAFEKQAGDIYGKSLASIGQAQSEALSIYNRMRQGVEDVAA